MPWLCHSCATIGGEAGRWGLQGQLSTSPAPVAWPCCHPHVHVVQLEPPSPKQAQPHAATHPAHRDIGHTCVHICTQMLLQGHSQAWHCPPSHVHSHGCTCVVSSEHRSHRVLTHNVPLSYPHRATHTQTHGFKSHVLIAKVSPVLLLLDCPRVPSWGEPVASPVF